MIVGQPADLFDTTNPDWAPITNLGHNNIKSVTTAISRSARFKERQNKKFLQSTQLSRRKKKKVLKVHMMMSCQVLVRTRHHMVSYTIV